MKAGRVTGLDARIPLRVNAAAVISVRLAELTELGEAALKPSAAGAQHDTRIAAKRVRYLLEIAGECFEPEARAAHDMARDLQGVLGDLHDCDVLLERTGGIESLQALLHDRRALLFERFRDLWRAALADRTWERLEARLQRV